MPSEPATHHTMAVADGAPVDEEEGGDGADVKRGHGDGRDPVDALGGFAPIEGGDGCHDREAVASSPAGCCNTCVTDKASNRPALTGAGLSPWWPVFMSVRLLTRH